MDPDTIKNILSKLNGTVKIQGGQIDATLSIPVDVLLALMSSMAKK